METSFLQNDETPLPGRLGSERPATGQRRRQARAPAGSTSVDATGKLDDPSSSARCQLRVPTRTAHNRRLSALPCSDTSRHGVSQITAKQLKDPIDLLFLDADKEGYASYLKTHIAISGVESDATCTLTQTDAVVSGVCQIPQRPDVTLTGKVDGQKVTWTHKAEYNGSPLTLNYEGTIADGKTRGSVFVPEFSVDGEFTAVPAGGTAPGAAQGRAGLPGSVCAD